MLVKLYEIKVVIKLAITQVIQIIDCFSDEKYKYLARQLASNMTFVFKGFDFK